MDTRPPPANGVVRLLSIVVFALLQVAFLPLAVVGAVMVGYKQIVVSKRLGVSQTGAEVLNGRWAMHVFGIREDRATALLAGVLPNLSTVGLWLCFFPLWIHHRLSGTDLGYPRVPDEGAEDLRDLIVARTLYFDRIIQRVAPEVDQLVVLGAGYDARSYGALKRPGLTFFELDQAPTQRLKVSALRAAGIDASHVTFVTVDFGSPRPGRGRGTGAGRSVRHGCRDQEGALHGRGRAPDTGLRAPRNPRRRRPVGADAS